MNAKKITILGIIFMTFACSNCTYNTMTIKEPNAKKIKEVLVSHNDERIDNYFWMRLSDKQKEAETADAQTQDVLDYLHSENDYLKTNMKETEPFQEKLFQEIVGRIKQDDQSVPVSINGYTYYSRYEEGDDYPLYCRKKNENEAKEEIMLNGPEMGKDQSYFSIGGRSVSENNELLAFSTDYVSRREYTISIKKLSTGKILKDKIENTTGGISWANDNKTIYYTKKDPITLRSNQIMRHTLGTDAAEDVLVYEEKDNTFGCSVYKSKSRKYIMIVSYHTLSTECRFLDANNVEGEWKIVQSRERNLEYSVDHFEDHFYILTNHKAKNFRLMKTSINATEKEHWKEIIAHRPNVFLEGIDIFKDYLVVSERKDGLQQLRVIKWGDQSEHYISFNDPTYSVYTYGNPEFDTQLLRFSYTSLTTPNTVYDYDLTTKDRTLRKQQEVLGGKFAPENYVSERLFAPSRDGKTRIPISIVYKKGLEKSEKTPLLLYGYGAYGYSMDPYFSSVRLSLLDRGFSFAIAHIRGGQEMGREWYEDGKLLNKKNSFYDFIDCGKYLADQNYTSAEHLYASGGSAGGLLMGGIINMEPNLWNGIIAGVPFVDAVTTMLDETIPLTTGEFDEWGNPKDKEYYDYIKSYSPYDNIETKDYPNLLITTGYWDSQVQYWEPAKWIAKLREYRTDDNLLIMHCNMDVGHGGASGRFKRYKEVALEYAFLLHLEKIKD